LPQFCPKENDVLITDLKQMEGKTIERAVIVDVESTIGLLFTDGSHAFIEAEFYDYNLARPVVIKSPGEHLSRYLEISTDHMRD